MSPAPALQPPARSTPLCDTGLPGLGSVPWGTHLFQLYQSASELTEVLVPYFKAGLETNEACLWVTSEPLPAAQAREALLRAVPELPRYEARGQIQIVDYQDWYLRLGRSDPQGVIDGWLEREARALREGFEGLRLTGNTFWLERHQWEAFCAYEAAVHRAFHPRKILALCSYALEHCTPDDIVDVIRGHDVGLLRKSGRWQVFDGATAALAAVSPRDHHHAVAFYEDVTTLTTQVVEFIEQGLNAGEAVVIIGCATNTHRQQELLHARGVDWAAAVERGQLRWLEASETLERLLVDRVPDPSRFGVVIGEAIARAKKKYRRVRAFGEMVNVLWTRGDRVEALALEELWETGVRQWDLELLCAYELDGFRDTEDEADFRDVCATHTHVLPLSRRGRVSNDDESNRYVAALERKARALETAVADRGALETRVAALLAANRESRDRLIRLQAVTASLLDTVTVADVRRVIEQQVPPAIDARAVRLLLPDEHGVLSGTVEAQRCLQEQSVIYAGAGTPEQRWYLPLAAGGRTHAVMEVALRGVHTVGAHTRALAEDLARHAGAALDRARLYDEANAAIQLREEFLSVASHELKTPLAALQLYVHSLRRAVRTQADPERIDGAAKNVSLSAERITRLVNELLDSTRITHGTFPIAPVPMDLCARAAEVCERFALEARRAGAALRFTAPPTPVHGVWDPERLDQVLTNLISNALKHGGGTAVELTIEAHEGLAVITVSDQGPGIPDDDQHRIFERFERAGPLANGGLGLGLWIVREIVRAHAGAVTVQSAPGAGARFVVELPRQAARLVASGGLEEASGPRSC